MKCSISFLLYLTATAGVCYGAVYFVSPTGNDSTGNGTISNPWQTINRGVSAMVGGDTLNIRAGTYPEQLNNNVPAGSSWSSPTTIQAYDGETVCLEPTTSNSENIISVVGSAKRYIVFNGLILDGSHLSVGGSCVKITYFTPGYPAQYIRFTNCVMRNAYDGMGILLTSSVNYSPTYCQFLHCAVYNNGMPSMDENPNKHGFYISTSGNLIDGCTIFSNLDLGVHLYNGRPSGNIIRNCTFSTTPGKDACAVYGGTNNAFYNNVFYGVNVGILVYPSDYATNTLIANNTFYSNAVAIIVQGNTTPSGSVTIENNLISNQTLTNYGGIALRMDASASSPITVRNNVIVGPGLSGQIQDTGGDAICSKNLTNLVSAGFVNASQAAFQLLTNSPAVNAGIPLSVFDTDKLGISRSQGRNWDVGAYGFMLEPPSDLRVVGPP